MHQQRLSEGEREREDDIDGWSEGKDSIKYDWALIEGGKKKESFQNALLRTSLRQCRPAVSVCSLSHKQIKRKQRKKWQDKMKDKTWWMRMRDNTSRHQYGLINTLFGVRGTAECLKLSTFRGTLVCRWATKPRNIDWEEAERACGKITQMKAVAHLSPREVRRLMAGDGEATEDGKEMSSQATPPVKTTTWRTSTFLKKLQQHRGRKVKWLRESGSQWKKTETLAYPKEVSVSGEFVYARAEGEGGLHWPLTGALVIGVRGSTGHMK